MEKYSERVKAMSFENFVEIPNPRDELEEF
jgi:hypothetical protein